MPDWTLAAVAVFSAYAVFVAISKTGVPGIGLLGNVVLISAAAAWMGTKATVGLMLPVLIVGDLFAVAYHRRHAEWGHLLRILPWVVVGLVAGYGAMGVVSDVQLKRIIGGIVAALLAVDFWRSRRKGGGSIPTQWWFAGLIGVLAGFATMVAHAAGPLATVYLLAMRLEKRELVGTRAWFFLIVNCLKVPFFLHLEMITAESLKADTLALPGIAVGTALGILVFKHLPQKWFLAVVRVLTLAAAVKLLLAGGSSAEPEHPGERGRLEAVPRSSALAEPVRPEEVHGERREENGLAGGVRELDLTLRERPAAAERARDAAHALAMDRDEAVVDLHGAPQPGDGRIEGLAEAGGEGFGAHAQTGELSRVRLDDLGDGARVAPEEAPARQRAGHHAFRGPPFVRALSHAVSFCVSAHLNAS